MKSNFCHVSNHHSRCRDCRIDLGASAEIYKPYTCFLHNFTKSRLLTARQQNIPFTILERDGSANIREQEWAITLHWALPLLKEMLPRELIAQIERCQVNFEDAENDTRDFKFINLEDCSEIFNTPSAERWRVARGKLRLALMDGLNSSLRWNQHVEGIEHSGGLIRIRCEDSRLHIANVVIENSAVGTRVYTD